MQSQPVFSLPNLDKPESVSYVLKNSSIKFMLLMLSMKTATQGILRLSFDHDAIYLLRCECK